MKRALGQPIVRETLSGKRPLRKLFSKEQRAFFTEHAPEGSSLDDLAVLGPIFVLKLKWAPEDFARKLVAELWFYPNDRRILELSTKCAPGEAFEVAAETGAYLTERGVNIAGPQQTKTRTALKYFSKQLEAEAMASSSLKRLPEPSAVRAQGASVDADRYFNRELSLLDYNARILACAEDESRPVLERARFLAILGRNLDEFFQIRVSGRASSSPPASRAPHPTARAREQLDAIRARAQAGCAPDAHLREARPPSAALERDPDHGLDKP